MSDLLSKRKSFVFLSLLCFSLADVRDGLGPFLGVYLQGEGWRPDEIGFIMTAGGLAGLVCTTPLGALADYTRYKRSLLAFSILLIVIACGIIFFWSGALAATGSKVLSCAAAAAIMPSLTGITLGMTGQKDFPARLGRNEAWSHAGNAATALLGGIIGLSFGIPGVFVVMALMGAMALFCLWRINPANIDYAVARGLVAEESGYTQSKSESFRYLFTDKSLLVVGMTLFFFHLVNAARCECGVLYCWYCSSGPSNYDFDCALGGACCSEKRLWPAFLHGTIGTTLAWMHCRVMEYTLEYYTCAVA